MLSFVFLYAFRIWLLNHTPILFYGRIFKMQVAGLISEEKEHNSNHISCIATHTSCTHLHTLLIIRTGASLDFLHKLHKQIQHHMGFCLQ